MKITGFDQLQRQLADAQKAFAELDGNLTTVQYDPQDPGSIEIAIQTMEQAIDSVGNLGRAVMVGLNQQPIQINTYMQVLGKEAEIIGSNDHLLQELPLLVDLARRKILDTSRVVSQVIPLDADKINQRLDDLENFTSDVRVVIVP